ncbi:MULTISPECIES: thiolase domain-containing protein [Pyrobaculum]|uniref:Acetyl-CoA C-acyltransferase n=2 Tax=Pyrobaculum aerophilum TaxID=13773 RepID=Q8ZV38_PYRAE|nr:MULTISPECIES: thiolase domain-containing protein [Pyrobaculum]MCY0891401.1 thiolase domain-containing protein [Pyrobaculum arsenaticum]AAL64218.1 acetyl-CoA C-acyltransferase [Pyrobaculum aerophilum str. IM2]MCX8135733.1 thiolase domain-containing protein [Pyrobaculum aerophilum]RFA93954.1 acetyl-CoA acyltransferase [Pyrobaculum aerophilum]RFA96832.1 acetyl-CoA acyltransferase [Pyrobaculum aerophilum]
MVLAYLVAAGMSKIGKREEGSRELINEAFAEIEPLIDPKEIEAVYVGVQSETYEHQIMYGTLAAEVLGLLPKEAYRVEACAAAGALAFHNAVMAVKSGLVDVALAVGVEKMSAKSTEEVTDALMAASDLVDQLSGVTIPAHYAMIARRYMYQYGATEEDMCKVAVKNHKHALDNPKAHFRKQITVEECLNSRPIATPLKLLDSAPISDGAAVAVVASERVARKYTDTPIKILASTVATDTLSVSQREDMTWPYAVWEAAQRAYRQAKVEPSHIQVAEVHDAFTINEILMYEALGFSKRGSGYMLIREGQTYIGGKIAVNPSGGLKARGHPIGATGLAQIYELYLQLTGRAGSRNTGAELGLAVNEGGVNSAVVVHILKV